MDILWTQMRTIILILAANEKGICMKIRDNCITSSSQWFYTEISYNIQYSFRASFSLLLRRSRDGRETNKECLNSPFDSVTGTNVQLPVVYSVWCMVCVLKLFCEAIRSYMQLYHACNTV